MAMKSGSENEEGTKKPVDPQEELLKIIQKQNEQLAHFDNKIKALEENQSQSLNPKMLESILEKFAQANSGRSMKDDDAEIQPPLSDYDEVGVRFCAPKIGYFIIDDKRKGRVERLPFNKKGVFFEHAATRIMQVGKYQATAPISVYRSHSKAEIAWIREHSRYGTEIYESSTEAAHADAVRMARLANIMQAIQNYELPDLMKVAKENNVAISEDSNALRTNIAFAILDRELAAENMQTKKTLEETYKHSVLLGKK